MRQALRSVPSVPDLCLVPTAWITRPSPTERRILYQKRRTLSSVRRFAFNALKVRGAFLHLQLGEEFGDVDGVEGRTGEALLAEVVERGPDMDGSCPP